MLQRCDLPAAVTKKAVAIKNVTLKLAQKAIKSPEKAGNQPVNNLFSSKSEKILPVI